nr:hypothetical protein [Rhodococcus sp. KRD162]
METIACLQLSDGPFSHAHAIRLGLTSVVDVQDAGFEAVLRCSHPKVTCVLSELISVSGSGFTWDVACRFEVNDRNCVRIPSEQVDSASLSAVGAPIEELNLGGNPGPAHFISETDYGFGRSGCSYSHLFQGESLAVLTQAVVVIRQF